MKTIFYLAAGALFFIALAAIDYTKTKWQNKKQNSK